MESRVCGGCGSGGFMTLSTTSESEEDTLVRLAYLKVVKDVPPMPVVGGGAKDGHVSMWFYELWNEPVWKQLLGDEPTLAGIQDLARAGKLRLSKIIKSPSGIVRARIYDTDDAIWEPVDDEAFEGWPSLHKNLIVRSVATKQVKERATSPRADG